MLLPMWRNSGISGNKLVRKALEALQQRLPSGWEARLIPLRDEDSESDASFLIEAPDSKAARLLMQTRPRDAN
jgi:hypothetical protein